MRAVRWLGVLALGLGLAGSARAQGANTWGGYSGPVINRVIDIDAASPNVPIARPLNYAGRSGFRLTDYMPRFPFMNNRPVTGQSMFPRAQDMPNAQNYLSKFKYGRGVPVVP